ncbi:DegT/DnrJ/EryC1/StrS family aminotransferase [Kordiimonas gwangyangensis]|uniref:DegT/DnrJ/EryC1/StrS family aminotransferase n=2 Tax=Kordiimonas gwangyangensis TaxID=288022 RepID=UPI000377D419|nr:DegT/DnrJ/EryC1/StrS family aminotransferase [Kordiimonas gwangyangensis]
MADEWKIKCLVPDLPSAQEVLPYLERMDSARWYSNFGPLVTEFEARMADFIAQMSPTCRTPLHTVTFSSATTALELYFRASGLPDGARILVPGLTFSATAASVAITGNTPVFSDVDPDTWDLTPAIARAALEKGPLDAVLPVAIYGYPLDMDAWAAFEAETGVKVIVDAAAALGNQHVHADVPVIFSLHATKPFGVGEGGLLVTSDAALADKCRRLSNFAFDDGTSRAIGTNAKMAEAMAAYGLAQIERFPAVQARRREVLAAYVSALGTKHFHPKTADYVPGTLLFDTEGKADAVEAALTSANIQIRKWYFPPLREHAAFRGADIAGQGVSNELPVIESLKSRLVGLPFHAFLSDEDISHVADCIRKTTV